MDESKITTIHAMDGQFDVITACLDAVPFFKTQSRHIFVSIARESLVLLLLFANRMISARTLSFKSPFAISSVLDAAQIVKCQPAVLAELERALQTAVARGT
jgi:hypothetical protein